MPVSVLLLPAVVLLGASDGSDKTFAERIAPLLEQRCVTCHNQHKSRGGLTLTRRETILAGGEHGAVLVPGKAAKSRLLDVVSGPMPLMPRQGAPLSTEQVADLRRWIDDGAPWPQ